MDMGSGVSTITSKWQVTIPGEIRKALEVQVGERLAWEVKDGVLTARRLPRLSSLAGCLGSPDGASAVKVEGKSARAEASVSRHKRISGATP